MNGFLGEDLHLIRSGEQVRLCGWVQTVRNQKRMQFVVLRDHTGQVQITQARSETPSEIEQIINGLTRESVIEVAGEVKVNPQVKLGGIEIEPISFRVVSLAAVPFPLAENAAPETRLDWRFLDLRRPEVRLVFEIQTAVEQAMRRVWEEEGFIEIHSPKLMGSASESGAELFRVDYFGGAAFLAQSPQFYKQMAMAAGFDRVFEIGPVFRANPSFTTRHDTEFISVDVEMSWVDSHQDVMVFEERWLRRILEFIHNYFGASIKEKFGCEITVPKLPFPRIPISEAYRIIAERGHQIERGGDLDPQGEKLLAQHVQEEFGHEFVFVTDYPISVRPFYHMRHADNPGITKSFDLIWKGVEVTTGAQREHRLDVLTQQAIEKGIDLPSIQYYLDFFKYGCPPHGGYGFGLTRMLMMMLGTPNVREVTYLYRGVNRLTP